MADKPTALYRLLDASGRLLYVGIGYRVSARYRSHAAEKDWWPLVASRTVEWFETREAAEVAEEAAINTEAPLFNKTKYRQRVSTGCGNGAILAEVSEAAIAYQATCRDLDEARRSLAALLNEGYARGMTQAHLLRLTKNVWSVTYLRTILGLTKAAKRGGLSDE